MKRSVANMELPTDFYVAEDGELANFKCDQTIITYKKFLSSISGLPIKKGSPSLPLQSLEWYPFVNSYYSHTEDVDAFARINHLLDTRASYTSNSTFNNNYMSEMDSESYSEKGAQLRYLTSRPLCFLVLGKPGSGEEELGRQLAEHWKCVYIDPETLVRDEIESLSRAGYCIEFNLRCGRAIGVDVLLRLLEKRVKSRSADHRGFVLCGFPLIPNDLYEEDPVSSESAVFNVQEIFEDIVETIVGISDLQHGVTNVSETSRMKGEGEEEEDEIDTLGEEVADEEATAKGSSMATKKELRSPPADIGSAHGDICKLPEVGSDYEYQMNMILNFFEMPFMIIYVTCSSADLISMRSNIRFDVTTGELTNFQKAHAQKVMYTVFSREPGAANEGAEDFFDFMDDKATNAGSGHLVQVPRDFPYNVASQLDRYHYSVLSVMEKLVLSHNPQYYVKVDGRTSPSRMFSIVKTKLRVLPVQKVIVPERLHNPPDPAEMFGEEPASFDPEGLTPEECFQEYRKKDVVGRSFKWSWSDWGSKCPVSMKTGVYVDGDPKYAVQFMNKIFYLRDEEAYVKFYRNPRPYLLPPYPKISGKIFVMGPKHSGKTAVSHCLAYLLDAVVMNPEKTLDDFKKKRRVELIENTRTAALNEGIALLNEKRKFEMEMKETHRLRKVRSWLDRCKTLLNSRTDLVMDSTSLLDMEKLSPFPLELGESSEMEFDENRRAEVRLRVGLEENNLYCFENVALCRTLLDNEGRLMEFLPENLRPDETEIQQATVFDDFVVAYAEKAVNDLNGNETVMTTEFLHDMYSKTLREIEDDNEKQGKPHGGWVIDGMPPNKELIRLLQPEFTADHVFILMDDVHHQFLLDRLGYIGTTDFHDFRNFFLDLGNVDAAWRAPSLSENTIKIEAVKDVLADLLDISYEETPGEGYGTSEIRSHMLAIREFYEQWDELSKFFVEQNVEPFEIDIADKSIEDVLTDVVKRVEDQYRQLATIFTPDDRLQEIEDFGEPGAADEMAGEEGVEEEPGGGDDTFMQNRRYGDTLYYCPVTFHDYFVLWKGKEELGAKFDNKLYFMCNEEALSSFLDDPRRYLPMEKPPESFPPPRICVVGPAGSGRTTVAKAVSKNIGLYYRSFEDSLKKLVDPSSGLRLKYLIKEEDLPNTREITSIREYLQFGAPLHRDILLKCLSRLWFKHPAKHVGFVLDGFPNHPSDIEFMTREKMIPDVIIELKIIKDELYVRTLEKRMAAWASKMERDQEKQDMKNRKIVDAWEEARNARYKTLMDIKREERYAAKVSADRKDRPYLEDLKEVDEDVEVNVANPKSQISFDSVAEAADINEIENILNEELPEPVFEDNWETREEALERFAVEIGEAYASELESLRNMQDIAEAEQILWGDIDANLATEKVIAQAYRLTNQFKFRNNSMFERCYEVAVDVAEKLLEKGYYFLSRFGRTCPVQYFQNKVPMQMFLPLEQKYKLFPIIHRQYVYYLAGKQNKELFLSNPLKYLQQENVSFPLVPLRVAIIGPPKCGKTKLAERFRRDLAMKLVSRGKAARYVLKYLPFSSLAKNMDFVLRKGWEPTDEMIVSCVEACAYDGNSQTQGVVFDGFPISIQEVSHLSRIGMLPNLIIVLTASRDEVHNCLSTDTGKRNFPLYSRRLIDCRYNLWEKSKDKFLNWLDRELQVATTLPIQCSLWGIWTSAHKLAMDVLFEIQHYHKYATYDWPMRLGNMLITPLEYLERRSVYFHYCPVCLYHSNKLTSGGDPPDRTGLVQYRHHFYYVCPEHIEGFINCPDQFLPPYNTHKMPADLPERAYLDSKPDNVHEQGFCVICFTDNRPNYVRNDGSLDYCVSYLGKVYMFDTQACMNKFLAEPHVYAGLQINFKSTQTYPPLGYQELPTLGLLEQYVARQVVKAVTNTGILRPVVPGLSIEVTAAINVGLHLKINNPLTSKEYLPYYREAHKLLLKRRDDLMASLALMKKTLNPYIYYEEPMPPFVLPPAPHQDSSRSTTCSVVGIIDDILDRIDYNDKLYD